LVPILKDITFSVRDWGGGDPSQFKVTATGGERLVWFVPGFIGRRIISQLWVAEFGLWLLSSVALLKFAKHRRFRWSLGITALVVLALASLAIPTKRMAPRGDKFDMSEPIYSRGAEPNTLLFLVETENKTLDEKANLGLGESIKTIFLGSPTGPGDPATQFVFGTIKEHFVAPPVMATWVLAIFLMGFAGFRKVPPRLPSNEGRSSEGC
jgi:hypothetical protein